MLKEAFGGVVIEDGRVLLREPRGHYGGYVWTFPKGQPASGETGEETAIREVLEETGVFAGIVKRIPGTFDGSGTRTTYYLMARLRDGEPIDRETERIVWVSFAEARSLIKRTTFSVGRRRDLGVLERAFRAYQATRVSSA